VAQYHVRFGQQVRNGLQDSALGFYSYKLATPLAPGASWPWISKSAIRRKASWAWAATRP
jgi:hypothetical protein